ncbi:P-loop NTPase fold protein [Symbioplanes lichenis]|uniref:P-loop NTPase fold protein n=1 Tax=Symbioplanes lichenis TaxID=1629072 RepID=UPI0027393C39|nr:P-loop NTPase fold protein [Actinoplanes lichenis]
MPEQIRALTSLSLSGDTVALAALAGEHIVFYDLEGAQREDPAPIDVGPVNAMSRVVSGSESDLLATGADSAKVTLWNPRTRTSTELQLDDSTGDLTAMTTMAGGQGRCFVVVGTVDGSVLRCDVESRSWVGPVLADGLQAVFALEAMPLADGRRLLASAGEDRALRVWDPDTGAVVARVTAAHAHAIRALVFIPDFDGSGERLASADEHGHIKLWRLTDKLELIRELEHRHHRPVSTLAVMPAKDSDPATLISAGKDESIRRWTVDGDAIDPASLGHIGSITAIVAAVTPLGDRVLASAGRDAKVWIWNIDSGQARFAPPSVGRVHSIVTAELPDGIVIAAAGDDGRIKLRRLASPGATPEILPGGHTGSAFRVTWLPDRLAGTALVSVGADGSVLHWATLDGPPVELARDLGVLYAVSDIELPDGTRGIACAGRQGVFVLDPANPSAGARKIFGGSTYALVSGELTDRSQGVAAAGEDGVIRLLNPAEAEPVHRWDEHEGPVRCLAKVILPGERNSLISAGADGTVRIWDTRTGSRVLVRHDDTVLDLLILGMPDGRQLLISTGEDRRVQYLDLNAVDQPMPIDTRIPEVSALCAVPAAGRVHAAAAGSSGGRIRLIDLVAEYGDLRFRGASDRAVRYDRLHRKNLIAEIVDLLHRTTDNPQESGPTVLSAEGAWGSGKSSVLEVVRRKLDQAGHHPVSAVSRRRLTAARADVLLGRPSPWSYLRTIAADLHSRPAAQPEPPRWVTAWFNPWAHQTSEQIWAGLTLSILNAAGQVLYPSEPEAPAVAGSDSRWTSFRARRQKRRSRRRRDVNKEWYWLSRNRRHAQTRQLRWTLRRRALSPLLAIAVAGLLVPVIARLLDPSIKYSLWGHSLRGSQVAMALPAVLLALGVIHSVFRYYCGRASRWLPPEVFAGPLPSGGQSSATAALPDSIRDPFYSARAGYLYLVQHDVGAVLDDLRRANVDVIVFVDDLDRCNPGTTAEVLEAINLFLSERLNGTRFVLGLDPAIVAAHLDSVYPDLAARSSGEDPSFGWTFLRKLIQLPIVLPRLHDATIDRLVADLLQPAMTEARQPTVPGTAPDGDGEAVPEASTTPDEARPALSSVHGVEADEQEQALPGSATPSDEQESSGRDDQDAPLTVVMRVARDRHPLVRDLLAERIKNQAERSPRDIKRLLTVWQYYVRVLDRTDSGDILAGDHVVRRARNLVIFAEIVTRWPALRGRLQASATPPPGLREDAGTLASGWRVLDELAHVAGDDSQWSHALVRLKLTGEADRTAMGNLRRLLRDYHGEAVAALARHIW